MTATAIPALKPVLREDPLLVEQEYPPLYTSSDRKLFNAMQDMELPPRIVVCPFTWSSDGSDTLYLH